VKPERQLKILEIISQKEIKTQEELSNELKKLGYNVTQATVSRDIKELRLIKTASSTGGYKYATMEKTREGIEERLHKLFTSAVLSMQSANNIIVIKTISGSANTVAVVVDALKNPDIVGCVAGDDTILVVVSSTDAVQNVMDTFQKLIS